MKFASGLIFVAEASMPLMVATKNGLPSEPTEMPTVLRSLAAAGAATAAATARPIAMRESVIFCLLRW